MHVLVMTVVHNPEDARILHRQIRALVDAGHEVTYAASYTAHGVVPRPWVTGVTTLRGDLFTVVDLLRWLGWPPMDTQAPAPAHLVSFSPLLGVLAVWPVQRLLGLRSADAFTPAPEPSPTPVVRQVLGELGNVRDTDISHARTKLGWSPRPPEESVLDTARDMIRLGIVKV